MAVNNLTEEQKDFIQQNKGKMKQVELARLMGLTPACINQHIKRKGKVIQGYFNVEEYKNYYR